PILNAHSLFPLTRIKSSTISNLLLNLSDILSFHTMQSYIYKHLIQELHKPKSMMEQSRRQVISKLSIINAFLASTTAACIHKQHSKHDKETLDCCYQHPKHPESLSVLYGANKDQAEEVEQCYEDSSDEEGLEEPVITVGACQMQEGGHQERRLFLSVPFSLQQWKDQQE
ncbi:uncharacterized protein BT62DRAFT_1041594, partial [Guyanagaster necrorhizus]